MKGRRPKPRVLQMLSAKTPKPAAAKRERELPAIRPEPPTFLTPVAREEWDRILPVLIARRCLTASDTNALAVYCQTYAKWRQCEEGLARSTPLIKNPPSDRVIANPLIAIIAMLQGQLLAYQREFGLTPASRAALERSTDASTHAATPADDEWASFANR